MADNGSIFSKIREARQIVRYAIDRATGHIARRNLAMRDARMFDLLQKGRATSTEIFYADFGTRNPNGLDIVHDTNDECVFRDLMETEHVRNMDDKERKKFLARVGGTGGDQHFINLRSDFLECPVPYSGLTNLISHEHIHRRQGLERDLGWASVFEGRETFPVTCIERGGTIGKRIKSLSLQFNHAVVDLTAQFSTKFKVSDYYAAPAEIQARMHEILTQGYAEWQKMPTTQTELWAAMHKVGLSAPLSVLRELYTSKEGLIAMDYFRSSSYLKNEVKRRVQDINRVYEFAGSPARKNILWRQSYPALYGNLLELMGDRLGRERMGLGESYRPAIEILRALDDPQAALPDNFDEMLDRVPPDLAKTLFNSILWAENSGAHPQADAVLDRLLEKPAHRDAILNSDQIDTRKGLVENDCLVFAMARGKLSAFQKLLGAGGDPLQKLDIVRPVGDVTKDVVAILDMLDIYKDYKKVLSGDEAVPRKLKNCFNKDEYHEGLRQYTENIEKAAHILIEHYPDIDTPRTITIDGEEQTVSMRGLLRSKGLDGGSPAVAGRKDDAAPAGL